MSLSFRLTQAAAIVALLTFPALAMAQGNPQTRSGFGISFGFGGGTVGTSCDNCTGDRVSGGVGYLRIGGHIRPNLLLAGESNAWVNGDQDVDESLSFATFVAHWYPRTASGLYLRAGAGVSLYANKVGFTDYASSAGTITFGIGYDWRVGKNFSLTPFAHVFGTGPGEMYVDGDPTGATFSNSVIQFGLGFTWH